MKVTTSAILTCTLVLMGTMCAAADGSPGSAVVSNKSAATTNQYAVDESKVIRNQKLRAWVDSIKPAAGHVEPATQNPQPEYWRQSVRRENRGSMQE